MDEQKQVVYRQDGVVVSDMGNANSYEIELSGGAGHPVLFFQNGHPDQFGFNGVTNEALIAILLHRTKILDGKCHSIHNDIAMIHLGKALDSFEARAAEFKKDTPTDSLDAVKKLYENTGIGPITITHRSLIQVVTNVCEVIIPEQLKLLREALECEHDGVNERRVNLMLLKVHHTIREIDTSIAKTDYVMSAQMLTEFDTLKTSAKAQGYKVP